MELTRVRDLRQLAIVAPALEHLQCKCYSASTSTGLDDGRSPASRRVS